MAFFRGDVYSYALDKMTSLNLYLPHDDLARCQISRPMHTLVLLHGLQGNNSFWFRYSSVERYAQEHNVALIMPEAEMSMYVDMRRGLDYGTYIGQELKSIVSSMFHVPTDRAHYSVAGFSMGGYGALRLALRYPEEFGRCMCISGAFMLGGEEHMEHLRAWRDPGRKPTYDPEEELERTFKKAGVGAFGEELACLPENDLFSLAKRAVDEKAELPRLLLTCGSEDFLLNVNRSYARYFASVGLPYQFESWSGDHNWKFVDESMERYFSFFTEP